MDDDNFKLIANHALDELIEEYKKVYEINKQSINLLHKVCRISNSLSREIEKFLAENS